MVAEKIGNANKVKTSMGEVMIRVAAGDEATSAATIRRWRQKPLGFLAKGRISEFKDRNVSATRSHGNGPAKIPIFLLKCWKRLGRLTT